MKKVIFNFDPATEFFHWDIKSFIFWIHKFYGRVKMVKVYESYLNSQILHYIKE